MNKEQKEYDVVIVGSGTCGATIARELSEQGKRILVLERGISKPLKDSFLGIASVIKPVPVSNKINTMSAVTTGGSTALYFAVTKPPPVEVFSALGVELSRELDEVRKELPLNYLPEELLGRQTKRFREAAIGLGHTLENNMMLIDQSKCRNGYSYEAKWKARTFIDEAVKNGALLLNGAEALKVIFDRGTAVGIEYKLGKGIGRLKTRQAYGTKVILAAGSLATPKILQRSGIKDIASHGFFFNPGFAMFGIAPGLNGGESFLGSLSTPYEDDISLGDASFSRAFHKVFMLGNIKFKHLLSFENTLGVGVQLRDGMGGRLKEDGCFHKDLTADDIKKMKNGEKKAISILKKAGATHIFRGRTVAANPSGILRIQEHLDDMLQTRYRNLHVCDASVLSDEMRVPPTLTLVCLAKYLANRISPLI